MNIENTQPKVRSQPSESKFNPAALNAKISESVKQTQTIAKTAVSGVKISTSKLLENVISPRYQKQLLNFTGLSHSVPTPEQAIAQPNIQFGSNDNMQNLTDIARESTQNKIVSDINKIGDNIVNFPTGTPYQLATPDIVRELSSLRHDTDVRLDKVVTELTYVKQHTSPIAKLVGTFDQMWTTIRDLLSLSRRMQEEDVSGNNIVKNDYELQKKWFNIESKDKLRREAQDVKNPLTLYWEKLLGMSKELIVPNDSKRLTAVKTLNATATFFGFLGGISGQGLLKLLNRTPVEEVAGVAKGIGGISGFVTKLVSIFSLRGILAPVFTGMRALASASTIIEGLSMLGGFILGSAAIMGSIIAFLGASAIYAAIKNPEQMQGYLSAFDKIFGNIIAVVKQISIYVGQISVALWEWWNSEGESGFLAIGKFVNDVLIYLLGNMIPNAMTAIGHILKNFVDGLTAIYQSVIGLFGMGPNGDKGILFNIEMIIDTIIGFISSTAYEIVSAILNMTGISEPLNNMWASFKGWWDNLVVTVNSFIADKISSTMTFLSETWEKLNPIDKIGQWLKDIAEFIMGVFPSVDDIKRFMIDSVRGLPGGDFMSEWLTTKLKPESIDEKARKANENIAQTPIKDRSGNVVIMQNAPSNTVNNMLSGMGRSSGGGGVPNTAPAISYWDDRVNHFSGR